MLNDIVASGAYNQRVENEIGRIVAANGTYNCVPAGHKVKPLDIYMFDPSDSGGTVTIKDRSGTTIFQISAVNQGKFPIKITRIQTADDAAPSAIDGLQFVVANCTGTFSIGVSWLGGPW